ncbi:glycosyltransferase family 1 protein [Halanaerobium sp. ST460_2HS_T2]|uniref:glycosyltransferase family 1 protein n=1 Tax=Halanaerobium sp. ST460_2HS_T2 TaxID=2183914 RepID=UPI000DF182EE|nr:glycosyltransferase family 1 protein [Halanaerobium sp. ST460_2HS_T2]RCW53388.1 glycosyltransferase involved in cell wall biosynthesis [Halanaerobium sp. ST460_2HS_T2]
MLNKPVRVLHIVSVMDHGGIENLLMNIYRNMDKEKVQFDFLVTRKDKGIFDEEIKKMGGKIYNISHISQKGYFKYRKKVDEFFKEKKDEYKIIHCHMNTWAGFFIPIAKKNNIPIRIAHSHTADYKVTLKNLFKFLIKKYHSFFINNNTTHFFACSKQAGKWLFGKRIADTKLKIVRNAIKTKKFRYNKNLALKKRKQLDIDSSAFVIGHVGRFTYQKNHEFLIDIFKKISIQDPSAILILVGAGELEDKIKRKVKEINLQDKVKFLGLRNDVNELMMMFDIFLFPSRYEGFGIVALESQAAGAKTIISDEVPEEINITDLVKRISLDKSTKHWADIVLKFKDYNNNRDYYKQIVDAGYDIQNTAEELQNFYLNQHKKLYS